MEREEGEMSDDDAMFVDGVEEVNKTAEPENVAVIYKAEKNGLVVEKLQKVDATKIEERAKRFGLDLTGNKVITQNQIDELYHNMGIFSGEERHFRFDTLHLHGVDGLSSKDIFEYLEDYKPVSLEWVDVNTCNVICQDHISAALALLVHSREIQDTQIKDMIASSSKYHWREGVPHHKKDFILMRFATNSDKVIRKGSKSTQPQPMRDLDDSMEPVNKNPWGNLSKSWGVYDHQEVWNRPLSDNEYEVEQENKTVRVRNKHLAKRLGKRPKSEDSDSSSSTEWRKQSKAPRMRMRADEEEEKRKKKLKASLPLVEVKQEDTELAPLSIEVINADTPYAPKESKKLSDRFKTHLSKQTNISSQVKEGVHARLGSKVQQVENELSDDDDDSSAKSEYNVMSRVEKVNTNRSNSVSDVWSRLEVQEKISGSDLRDRLKSKVTKKPNDLRERLGKPRQGESLRIEVDNDFHDSD